MIRRTLIIALISSYPAFAQKNDITLRFKQPAQHYTESLPLGNGRLGAMVYGKTHQERIALNEISLWSGGPQDADKEDAWQYLKPIQNLLLEGKNKEAQELLQQKFVAKGVGSGHGRGAKVKFGCYQTLGDLMIVWKDTLQASQNYKRELDLSTALAHTSFERNGFTVKQEVFTDFANDIIWVKLTSSQPNKLNFKVQLQRAENATTTAIENQIIMQGQLPAENEPGMEFLALAQVYTPDGKTTVIGHEIEVENASEVIIQIAANTNYNYLEGGLRKANLYEEALLQLKPANVYHEALQKSTQVYNQYFDRSRLKFPENKKVDGLSTLERLQKYAEGNTDLELPALYYHFGRYLLISSSRPGLLPANLQGLWATEYQTPWNGDYHLNINVQMNYWPAHLTGLGELAEPLNRFTKNLVPNGEKTAKAYYNAEGWVAHVISNPWFYTSPGEGADWGSTLTGGAWLCTHIWEQYQYTKDLQFLKTYYPVIKGSAQFIESILIKENKNGWLVTAPSNSPEHAYIMPNGFKGNTAMGPTMDMQIARQLFKAAIQASEVLNVDKEWRSTLNIKLALLAPNTIGKEGDINEWLEDWEDGEPKHRHVSHLYGLHPYDEINANATPELFEAAKKTLEVRGDEGTGWSMAWKINFWARLKDGDHALLLLNKLLKPLSENKHEKGGTYPNLFCAHPPFQIDGNFGATAGIAEMFVQYTQNTLELLPALPSTWKTGEITGIHTKNGFVVDVQWDNAQLKRARILSKLGESCTVKLEPGQNIYNEKGKKIKLNADGSFSTSKNAYYFIQ